MSPTLRYFARLFRVLWVIPLCLAFLAIFPPPLAWALGVASSYFVLVGRVIGMKHIEVGIGAGPSDTFGCVASVGFYLLFCAAIAGLWHFLEERQRVSEE